MKETQREKPEEDQKGAEADELSQTKAPLKKTVTSGFMRTTTMNAMGSPTKVQKTHTMNYSSPTLVDKGDATLNSERSAIKEEEDEEELKGD